MLMAVKTFHHINRLALADIGEEVGLLLALHGSLDMAPRRYRLTAWAKTTLHGAVNGVPLRPPIVKPLALSVDCFVHEARTRSNGTTTKSLVRVRDSDPARCAGHRDATGAQPEPGTAQKPRGLWVIDGFYTEHYDGSVQHMVDTMRQNGRRIGTLDAMRVVQGVVHAVAWLETRGAVHADVKLDNFLVQVRHMRQNDRLDIMY